MNRKRYRVAVILSVFLFFILVAPAYSGIDHNQARSIVQNLSSVKGGTVNQLLNDRAAKPVVDDLGWHTYPLKGGAFQIERLMLLNGTTKLIYRWRVGPDGKATAINGKAIAITR